VAAITRRTALKSAATVAVGVSAGVVAHGYLWARHAIQVSRVELPVAGLAPALDGLRIGLVTDLHLSALVPPEDVIRAVALVNAERPDLIVLGGDYISFHDRAYAEPVAEILAQATAPLGAVAILGNHDDERAMTAALERGHISVLADARTAVRARGASLELIGLKFWTRTADTLRDLLKGATSPVVLLAHDPRRVVEAASLGIPCVLSGHTHGGQIVIPGLGAPAARKFPVARGRLTQGGTELYVSAGVGTVVVPVRINCPPEVSIVTLRSRG